MTRLLAGCGLLAACTLTQEEFEPETLLRNNISDAGPESISSQTPEQASSCSAPGCCEEDSDCAADESCIAAVCAPRSCEGAEDVSACLIEYCPGPGCPSAPVSPAGTCNDGIGNGADPALGCGQSCPVRCAAGTSCSQAADCASFNCQEERCVIATCDDGIKNQDESAVDCGGACTARCTEGLDCNTDDDCAAALFCAPAGGVCTDSSCQDGLHNGSEIVADCGGGACPGCPAGTPCNSGADCASHICGAGGECTAASCDDSEQNQDETDVDCGGVCAETCAIGSECNDASDCASEVCAAGGCEPGVETCCQAPTCDDGVRNGNEPAVDCGSVQACGLCAVGDECTANGQCLTGICQVTCQPRPLCADGVQSGGESDVDCGGADPACARCADREACRVDGDCASGTCDGNVCVSCADGALNGAETGPDCGGSDPACARCADGSACGQSSDCGSGNCQGSVCISCGDGLVNGAETDADCGGADPACGRCAAGRQCSIDSDCSSGACQDGRCCGGSLGDCTRCAQRLSPSVDCNAPLQGVDSTGIVNCGAFLQCLADNPSACPTRNAPGCSGDDPLADACPHNNFGGNAGTGITRANQVLQNAGCQL